MHLTEIVVEPFEGVFAVTSNEPKDKSGIERLQNCVQAMEFKTNSPQQIASPTTKRIFRMASMSLAPHK
ncbi:hypothetical protein [Methylocystis sp. Sn-Cys]|uniref:hypothetical protein n=1 Tax=Methylocystis sp. Sn-Cys TaxID=1701263 RepID=UPI001FEEB74B|nr:hypothetical protein [Methylocystis sp. Sn-Cys]